MRSSRPKVLHPVAGKAMLRHVLDAVEQLQPARCVVVVGPGQTAVAEAAAPHATAWQTERLGTGHAVQCAQAALGDLAADPHAEVLVTCGDTPLLTADDAGRPAPHPGGQQADMAVLGFQATDPGAYGRLVLDGDGLLAADRRGQGRQRRGARDRPLQRRRPAGARGPAVRRAGPGHQRQRQGRVLPDRRHRHRAVADGVAGSRSRWAPESEMQGVNSRADLAAAEALQQRLRARALARAPPWSRPRRCSAPRHRGPLDAIDVTPSSRTWCSAPASSVGARRDDQGVQPLEGARVGAGAARSARTRGCAPARCWATAPGRQLRRDQERLIGEGSKANHLTYMGDTTVGPQGQHRRRHDHLQLRRLSEAPHRDRRGRVHRLGRAGRAGGSGRGRDRGRGHHHLTQDVADDARGGRAKQRTVEHGGAPAGAARKRAADGLAAASKES